MSNTALIASIDCSDSSPKKYDIAELERIMIADRPKGIIECGSLAEFRKQFIAHGKSYRYYLNLSTAEEYKEAVIKYNGLSCIRFSLNRKR